MFKLEDNFLRSYDNKSAPFGFNGLGELVYLRTYSRKIDASTRENWQQTVERVNLLLLKKIVINLTNLTII